MYKEYFGLKEEPFSIAPDPHFLYMSEQHREALAHLIYGMKADSGFVLLTGEVGTGKTTVCRCLLGQIPDDSEIAFVLNPKLSVLELLATICDELGIDYPVGNASVKVFVDRLNQFLLDAHSRGKKTVLIIDEAQNLGSDVLEQIRLLTNLETDKRKLLQVIMLGQPELNRMLERPELRQLAQRVTARYHLEPLSRHELAGYLTYRLTVAGVERPLFPQATINKLYRLSGGVPRLINLLCDRALLGAYARGENLVSPRLLAQAAAEVYGKKETSSFVLKHVAQGLGAGILLLSAILVVIVLAAYLRYDPLPENSERYQVEQRQGAEAQPEESAMESSPLPEPVPAGEVHAERPLAPSLGWRSSEPRIHSRDLAYQALLAIWGYPAPEQENGPFRAADYGLELLQERGSLARLRQLNHPAVLSVTDAAGDNFHVTLTGLDDETATLVIGTDIIRVSLTTLLKQWFGDYALLWQPPPGYQGLIRLWDTGIPVVWLEQQLAELSGRDARSEPGLSYDLTLMDEVRRFQREGGLDPDGLVGPYTLILLNSRLENDQPRLFNRQG